MNTKKKIGTIIIGVAITLVVAVLPLIIYGDNPVTGNNQTYNSHLEGISLFRYLLAIGLSIVIMTAIRDTKQIIKGIIYPILIALIIGIVCGVLFPIFEGGNAWGLSYGFNNKLFYIISGAGLIVSLIVLGIYLTRSK